MTRKKAIEAAAQQAIGDHKLPAPEVLRVWIAAGTAFDQGRIAGLREAARMAGEIALPTCEGNSYAAHFACKALRYEAQYRPREHARELAKKARGK